ncbi:hypothetical protein CANCADRAFT_1545 [Tortispora caseinolytica NRRL Y-17796]|uniref:RNA polymerase I associated factor, A49-like protein n=1 Tax=Tortispora caseinolytica NRRL Y-17796 TaxID=767744 RepID=A0A1E4TMF4_9ASCO|nr:hypothetical protein CANCADRAFT_1545 [Tortispora caseinolytica NRRL Y-17796]
MPSLKASKLNHAKGFLAVFKGTDKPNDAVFSVYKNKKSSSNDNAYTIHGESEDIEYTASPVDSNENHIAIFDPESNKLEFAPTSTFLVHPVIKKRKIAGLRKQTQEKDQTTSYYEQRTALGAAFGTKKAQKAISDAQRNAIDASANSVLEESIVSAVNQATENLPDRSSIQEDIAQDRIIPPINLDGTNIDEVYSTYDIIPENCWKSIQANIIIAETNGIAARLALLPCNVPSQYLSSRLERLAEQELINQKHQLDQDKVRLLYCIALFIGLYHSRYSINPKSLSNKLKNPPMHLLSHILDTYTTDKLVNGKNRQVIDPRNEDRLLAALIVLCLKLDGFLDVTNFAKQIMLPTSRISSIAKQVGANVAPATKTQLEALEMPLDSRITIAEMSFPVKLPAISRGRRMNR